MRAITFLLTAAALAVQLSSAFAQPAAWPSKPIRIVNGGPPGTPPDIFGRMYADKLSKALGVPVVVDNKPGASGNLATDAAAKSPADGYTVLYNVSNALTMNRHMYARLPFDSDKDLVPVAQTLQQGLVLIANNDLPANNLGELLALARSRPGELNYGSYGAGGYPHLAMELLQEAAKVKMVHIPYKQGVMNDVIGGQLQLLVEPIATAYAFIQSGKVKAIAYTGAKRHASLPNLPTIAETYPGVVAVGWHGIWAPAGTPKETIDRLNQEINLATRSADLNKRITDLNCEPLTTSPAEMAAAVRRDSDVWGRVIREKGIRLD